MAEGEISEGGSLPFLFAVKFHDLSEFMPQHSDTIILNARIDKLFDYYTNLHFLVKMSLPELHLRVVKAELPLRKGSRIKFGMRHTLFPFEVTWLSKIHLFDRNRCFGDIQVRGPFDHWIHTHHFQELEDGLVKVTDCVEYGTPLGIFGRFAEGLFDHKLEEQFRYRERILRQDFEHGGVPGN